MTYRELIEFCCKSPCSCQNCKYLAECFTFEEETGYIYPYELDAVVHFDYDKEIEAKE